MHYFSKDLHICESPYLSQKPYNTSHFTGYTYLCVMTAPPWLTNISLHSYAITVQFSQCVQILKTKISLQFHLTLLPCSSMWILPDLLFVQPSYIQNIKLGDLFSTGRTFVAILLAPFMNLWKPLQMFGIYY